MSINRLISIKNPIINALDMVGLDRSSNMPTFVTWAIQAEEEIASHYALVKHIEILDIKGCVAYLPCNAVYLQYAIMGAQDCSCNDLRNLCTGFGNPNVAVENNGGGALLDQNTFLIVDLPDVRSGNPTNLTGVQYEIQGNKLVFYNDLDGQQITVQYLGQKLDDEGFPMISQNHVRAIEAYILYKYCTRAAFSSNPGLSNKAQEHKLEWGRLCRHARADDAELSPSEHESVANALNDPYAGRGLYAGMRPVYWNYLW